MGMALAEVRRSRRWPAAVALVLLRAATSDAQPAEIGAPVSWHVVTPGVVEGQGWRDTAAAFDRLPARAEKLVREPVWGLSHDSTGLNLQFRTDATAISVRWTLNSKSLSMAHMPATGVSGVDLYVKHESRWHYLATGRATEFPTNEAVVASGLAGKLVEYRLYFPLYNGVAAMEIGVPEGAAFEFTTPQAKPRGAVVVYGTSITQGGCASRPGMAYPAILGRRLGVSVINLGFSGNGKAEPEVAELLAEIDPAAFVLDALPNLSTEDVAARMPAFIEILRKRRPTTPILLVESPVYTSVPFEAENAARVAGSNDALRAIHAARLAAGDEQIVLVPACDLSAGFGEGTVDGVHPTDLGFVQLADSIEAYLRDALD